MIDEYDAKAVLSAAIQKGRAAELVACLTAGGTATLDPTGALVLTAPAPPKKGKAEAPSS